MENLKMKIKNEVKTQDHESGLLTREEAKYLECLEFKKHIFEELLEQDAAFWAEHLDKAKAEVA